MVERFDFFHSSWPLAPRELAYLLEKEMDNQATDLLDEVLAPNWFTVAVADEDRRQWQPYESRLALKVTERLQQHATHKGYVLMGQVKIKFVADPSAKPGHPACVADFSHDTLKVARDRRPAELAHLETVKNTVKRPALHLVLSGGGLRQEYAGGRILVGRGSDADFQVLDERVSRHHALIEFEQGGVVLWDAGSKNKTELNGVAVEGRTPLSSGDRIRIGTTELEVQILAP